MIRLFMDNALFFSFNEQENSADYSLLSLKLSEEVNTLSHLSLTTLFTHPRLPLIVQRKSTFVLADDNECMFIGKVLTISKNMSNEVQIEVEDLLGCLRDQVEPGYEFESRTPGSVYRYEDYNGLVSDNQTYNYLNLFFKVNNGLQNQIYKGYNSLYTIPNGDVNIHYGYNSINEINDDEFFIQDPLDLVSNITLDNSAKAFKDDASNTGAFKDKLSLLFDDMNSHIGGIAYPKMTGHLSGTGTTNVKYIIDSFEIIYSLEEKSLNQFRTNGGALPSPYVDYTSDFDFDFGVNILNFEIEPAVNDPVSAIAPTGTYCVSSNDTSTRLVMLDNNYPNPYVINAKAYNKYGFICKNMDFGNVGTYNTYASAQSKLQSIAATFVNERLSPFGDRITITGIDPYYLGKSGTRKKLRSLIHVHSTFHKLDMIDYCLSYEVDFFNHENDKYIVGPFVPTNYLEYKSTNIKQKSIEHIIVNGEEFKKETGSLYVSSSNIKSAWII